VRDGERYIKTAVSILKIYIKGCLASFEAAFFIFCEKEMSIEIGRKNGIDQPKSLHFHKFIRYGNRGLRNFVTFSWLQNGKLLV
jgi:hypothetical protein